MRGRGLLATSALAGVALLVVPAAAGDETESCGLVQDALDDTALQGMKEAAGVLVQQDVDLTSADVATDEENLYAVLRVQSIYGGPRVGTGQAVYRLEFLSGTRKMFVQVPGSAAVAYPSAYGIPATAGRVGGRSYPVSAFVDPMMSEISVTAPLYAFGRGGVQPGSTLSAFHATAVRTYVNYGQLAPGVSSRVTVSDEADATTTYSAGTGSIRARRGRGRCAAGGAADVVVVSAAAPNGAIRSSARQSRMSHNATSTFRLSRSGVRVTSR